MNTKSLRTRLMTILLIVGIVPVFTTVLFNYFSNVNSFENIQTQQQKVFDTALAQQLANEVEEATTLARNVAQQPNIEVLDKKYWEKIEQNLKGQIYSLQVVADGTVIYQGANSVNMAKHWDEALKGQGWSGFEHMKGSLYLSVYMPIEQNGKIVGALQMHLQDEYMSALQALYPDSVISLADSSGVIKISTNADNYSKQFEQVSQTDIIHIKDKDAKILTSYIPLNSYIETSEEILVVENSIATMMSTLSKTVNMALIVFIATIIVAVVIAILYSRSLTVPLIRTSKLMNVLSTGDLTKRIETNNRRDEIGQLLTDIQQMQNSLHETITDVTKASNIVSSKSTVLAHSTQQVSSGALAINATMESLSQGIEKQTNHIAQVRDFVANFTVGLEATTTQGKELDSLSQNIRKLSTTGTEQLTHSNMQITETYRMMEQSIAKMSALGKNVGQITSFVSIIEEVANQTNLLALNASIEAARAGEHGKSFAVVANEVRKLAEQVASSVTQITAIVSTIQESSKDVGLTLEQGFMKMDTGSQQLASTVELFDEIEQSVNEMASNIRFVIQQLEHVSLEGHEIEQSMREITAVTEETAASVEETTAMVIQTNVTIVDVAEASEELSSLAEQLNEVVGKYKI